MILDVGCGDIARGDVNCDLLKDTDLIRWDQNPEGIPNFVKASVHCLPFRSSCFNVVYCSHVIEHLLDFDAALKELKRVSSKFVVVIVPFSLFRILDPLIRFRSYPQWRAWEKQHHKHFFWRDPFNQGKHHWKFRWIFQKYAEIKNKEKPFFKLAKLIPIPFETYTVFEVSDS